MLRAVVASQRAESFFVHRASVQRAHRLQAGALNAVRAREGGTIPECESSPPCAAEMARGAVVLMHSRRLHCDARQRSSALVSARQRWREPKQCRAAITFRLEQR